MRVNQSDWNIPKDWGYWMAWSVMALVYLLLPLPIHALINALFSNLTETQNGNPHLFDLSLSLATAGVCLLFLARLPFYRQRKFFSVGPRGLPPLNKVCYWVSYGFLSTAITLMALMLWALN